MAELGRIKGSARLWNREIMQMPLYPYQEQWAQHVLAAALNGRTETIIVEMPRQSGKNETSAKLEVQLLAGARRARKTIVKAAPTNKPQTEQSKLRFADLAQQAERRLRRYGLVFKPSLGYRFECGRAAIAFLSAQVNANVVGATANLLLEIDEAQDVQSAKYYKDFDPMRASTGAPLVMYGTTWTDDTLLERNKQMVLDNPRLGKAYRVTPDQVAEAMPGYGPFVDAKVAQLGRHHPLVATQYFLEPLQNRGRALPRATLAAMTGTHGRRAQRTDEPLIVAGLDFASADESSAELSSLMTTSKRDSTALTIGAAWWDERHDYPELRIDVLERYQWLNVHPVTLRSQLLAILDGRWQVNRIHCDNTGVGSMLTLELGRYLDSNKSIRLVGVTFDAAWNAQSRLAGSYLALAQTGRLKDYATRADALNVAYQDAEPDEETARAWWQRAHARLEGRESDRFRLYVPDSEGHDDLLISELLMVDAAHALGVVRADTEVQHERPLGW